MKKATSNPRREIRAIKRMKDSEIDTSDIPEVRDWTNAQVGKFYRPHPAGRDPDGSTRGIAAIPFPTKNQ